MVITDKSLGRNFNVSLKVLTLSRTENISDMVWNIYAQKFIFCLRGDECLKQNVKKISEAISFGFKTVKTMQG